MLLHYDQIKTEATVKKIGETYWHEVITGNVMVSLQEYWCHSLCTWKWYHASPGKAGGGTWVYQDTADVTTPFPTISSPATTGRVVNLILPPNFSFQNWIYMIIFYILYTVWYFINQHTIYSTQRGNSIASFMATFWNLVATEWFLAHMQAQAREHVQRAKLATITNWVKIQKRNRVTLLLKIAVQ